jgi:hypothetical protein
MKNDDIRRWWSYFRISVQNDIYPHLKPHLWKFAMVVVGIFMLKIFEWTDFNFLITNIMVYLIFLGLLALIVFVLIRNGKIYAEQEQKNSNAEQFSYHFKRPLTLAQVKQLLEALSKYIPEADPASFYYVFCRSGEKPDNFKPLNWEGQLTELSAFINAFFGEENKRWAKTACWFTQHGKKIDPKSLSSAIPSNEQYFKNLEKSITL